jgi:GT2 family glycosyltransferase
MSRYAPSQRPRLSIVIPTINDTSALEETLVSVLENRPDDCEIVVALGCEYDDPWNIREEVRFVQAPVGSGYVACANIGISASEGDVIHILAAGWRATSGWADGAIERFADGETAAVVPLAVSAADQDRVVGAGIRYGRGGRRIAIAPRKAAASVAKVAAAGIEPHGPSIDAGFWRSDVLRQVGPGFSTACGDRCADADMAESVARTGLSVVLEPSSRVVAGQTGAGRKQPFVAGLHAERLFWRSMQGRPIVSSLVMHGVEIVRHAVARAPFGTLPMLAGRAVAMMQFGSYLTRYRQLRGLVQAAAERQTADESRTIRIDSAHSAAGRPKSRRPETVPLRRSA